MGRAESTGSERCLAGRPIPTSQLPHQTPFDQAWQLRWTMQGAAGRPPPHVMAEVWAAHISAQLHQLVVQGTLRGSRLCEGGVELRHAAYQAAQHLRLVSGPRPYGILQCLQLPWQSASGLTSAHALTATAFG